MKYALLASLIYSAGAFAQPLWTYELDPTCRIGAAYKIGYLRAQPVEINSFNEIFFSVGVSISKRDAAGHQNMNGSGMYFPDSMDSELAKKVIAVMGAAPSQLIIKYKKSVREDIYSKFKNDQVLSDIVPGEQVDPAIAADKTICLIVGLTEPGCYQYSEVLLQQGSNIFLKRTLNENFKEAFASLVSGAPVKCELNSLTID